MAQLPADLEPSFKPRELSFPVPKSPHAILHVHLSAFGGCTLVHVTTSSIGEAAGSAAPLGSFVYAMPNRLASRDAISTTLFSSGSSIDYATRLSRILAIKMNQPVYVGCSMNFSGTTTEEELEGLLKVVEEVMKVCHSQPRLHGMRSL